MPITLNGTTGITNDGGYTGDGVSFADTTPANTLVTTTDGRVGIGKNNPSQKLDVLGLVRVGSGGTGTSNIGFTNDGGSFFMGLDSSTGGNFGAGNYGALLYNGANSPMVFFTNNSERMRIDSSGRLLVNTTTVRDSSQKTLDYNGAVANGIAVNDSGSASNSAYITFFSGGTRRGTITNVANTTVAYNTTSDYRLKENIAPMTGALDTIAQLKPCTYKWKATGSDGQGFIAHELQAVVPDCVTGEKDAVETYTDGDGNQQTRPKYQGIDTSFLVATLTAAIQEQQAMIEELKVEVQALKAK
jgi:hypothetical protein